MSRLIESMAAFTMIPDINSGNPTIPLDQRQQGTSGNSKRIYVDPGIYMVMMDWDGPERIYLTISRSTENILFVKIGEISAGVGPRSMMYKLVVSQRAILLPSIYGLQESTVQAGHAIGISVIRIGE